MKLLKLFCITLFATLSLQAKTTYVYVEEGIKLPPLKDGTVLFSGTPLQVVKEGVYEISGFIGEDKTQLFATKNLKLLLAISKNIKAKGNKGTLKIAMDSKNTESDYEEAWFLASDTFYNKCTTCHAAKVVANHTMLEWEGLYASMEQFAKPTKEDSALITRFLRAFAKDGILKESE